MTSAEHSFYWKRNCHLKDIEKDKKEFLSQLQEEFEKGVNQFAQDNNVDN